MSGSEQFPNSVWESEIQSNSKWIKEEFGSKS